MQVFFGYMKYFPYLCYMENLQNIMKDWVFTKSNTEKLFDLAGLKLTAEYTLTCLSKMMIGESIVMSDYAIKRIK